MRRLLVFALAVMMTLSLAIHVEAKGKKKVLEQYGPVEDWTFTLSNLTDEISRLKKDHPEATHLEILYADAEEIVFKIGLPPLSQSQSEMGEALYSYQLKGKKLRRLEQDGSIRQIIQYRELRYRIVETEQRSNRLERYKDGKWQKIREDKPSRDAKLYAHKDGLYYINFLIDSKNEDYALLKIYNLEKSDSRPIFSKKVQRVMFSPIFSTGNYQGECVDVEGLIYLSAEADDDQITFLTIQDRLTRLYKVNENAVRQYEMPFPLDKCRLIDKKLILGDFTVLGRGMNIRPTAFYVEGSQISKLKKKLKVEDIPDISQIVSYSLGKMIRVQKDLYLYAGYGASDLPGLFAVSLKDGRISEQQVRDSDFMSVFKTEDGQIYIYGSSLMQEQYPGVWLLDQKK